MKQERARILVACEFSGRVRDAFAKRGFDAWSCDLLPSETPGQHIQGDVLEHLNDGWDMMIAHPPCTRISRAGDRWLYHDGIIDQEKLRLGMEARDFFLTLWQSDIERIAIENPTPMKIFNFPRPTTCINPHEFGEPYSKRTLLWLKNLPPLMATLHMAEYKPYLPSNTGYGRRRGQRYQFKHITARDASRTFQGIADAMAAQWSPYLLEAIKNGQ